jgi:hypothetical protein
MKPVCSHISLQMSETESTSVYNGRLAGDNRTGCV